MAGIKETKEVVKFGLSIGHGIDKSMADGELGFADVVHFYDAMQSAGAAFKDISKVPGELADLDGSERTELLTYFEGELDLRGDELEATIEAALATALNIYSLVERIRGHFSKEESSDDSAEA